MVLVRGREQRSRVGVGDQEETGSDGARSRCGRSDGALGKG